MTQYQDPFGHSSTDPMAQPKTNSGLAVTALVFSLIFICPITTLLGPILGAIALATIGSDPTKKGKGLAWAAIILGVIFTVGWYFGGKMAVEWTMGWIQFVKEGPRVALQQGFAGNTAGFKAEFFGAGATASDAEATAFIEQLRSRYGTFTTSAFDEKSGQAPQTQPGKANVPFPYVLTFSNKTVDAEVELWFADQNTGTMMKKLGYIKVFDADAGDLVYPATGSKPSTPSNAPAADPDSDDLEDPDTDDGG